MSIENSLLERMDKIVDSLAALTERITEFEGRTEKSITELAGKIKGNQELIEKDLSGYVGKSTCEMHREKQGYRVSEIERNVAVIENRLDALEGHTGTRDTISSERITAWLPTIVVALMVVGGFIWVSIK